MWFKNLTLYRLTQPFELTPEQLAEAMEPLTIRPCGSLDPSSYGWTPPLGRISGELVHAANGCILVSARKDERVLPASVIREEVDERIAEIENSEPRKVRGKEKRRIKEDVIFDLLPRAFIRGTETEAYLSPHDGWLVINTTSPKRAEDLMSLLGHSLGSFEVAPFVSEQNPVSTMTGWLSGRDLPNGFVIQNDCELKDPADQNAVVRCQKLDLDSDEVQGHLRAHKEVHKLGLLFEERLSMVLRSDLTVSRLRFEAVDELDSFDDVDDAARLDANFAFMTTELGRLLERLDEVFALEPGAQITTRQFAAES